MNVNGFGRVALRCHGGVFLCPISRLSRHRLLLLLGIAGAALLAGTAASVAQSADTYLLPSGSVSDDLEFLTLFALSGTGEVTATAELRGIGDASAMAQTGGAMDGTVSGITDYTQSGGAMGGKVTATTYAMSGGTLSGEAAGFTSFLLSGGQDVIVSGKLVGATGSSVTQTGGKMNGNVSGIANYIQKERVGSAAVISFSQLYELVDGQVDVGARLMGGAGSAMTQTGPGKMQGAVTGVASYTQTAGTMNGSVSTGSYALSSGTLSGTVNFSDAFTLGTIGAPQSGQINGSALLIGGVGSTMMQLGGSMKGTVSGVSSYTQTAGDMGGIQANTNLIVGKVGTATYALSGGTVAGQVDFSSLFALTGTGVVTSTAKLIGGSGSTMTQSASTMGGTVTGVTSYTQSGGAMNGFVTGAASYAQSAGTMGGTVTALGYEQSGGSIGGTINVANYSLTGTGTSSGTINASSAFNLAVAGGTATVGGRLSGAGSVIKSGLSTVVLANDANDFSGGVAVDGGVLEVRDGALPGNAEITVADAATLRFNTAAGVSSVFDGTMSGATGVLEKTGLGTLTLGGDINLGALQVNAGLLNIGNGSPEEASFDSAYIGAGATVYVASGATLRIRIPKNIANFGTLTNDGTVYDDLDNAGMFVNNSVYVADVASNTRDIANNSPGMWTGDVLTNNGWINNNENATWNGDVVTNAALGTNGQPGRVANAGGIWRGDILSNDGHIINDNRADEIGTGYWIGDIVSNTNWIFNGGGGDWDGDVITNAGLVMNGKPAMWHGDVRSNDEQVWNGGVWNGKVLGNAGTVHNAGGTWNGNVEANTGLIQNIAGVDANGPTTGSTWIGSVVANAGHILNATDSSWTGDVLGNSGTIQNFGLWTGNFSNAGTVEAQNRIVGSVVNSGKLRVTGNLSGITTLTNSGTIDMTGGGSQVLSVASANLASGSFLDVQIDPNGNSDQVAVAGHATLGGTVRISNGGAPHTTGPFTIVTAGSLSGGFDAVTTDLAFLAPHLSYGPQAVSVDIQRNDLGFGDTGATGNQSATGDAVEALGAGNPLYDAVLWLTQAEAQSAFDQLSGEPHASHASAALENASAIDQIASHRVDQAFAALGEGEISSYAEGATPMPDQQPQSNAVWGQFYGARGVIDAGSGAAGVSSTDSGVVVGLDGLVADWRLGMVLQGGHSDMQVAALNASASSTDYGIGLYGGREFGDTLLSFGATYTRHDNSTARQVSFPGFTDKLSANYASGTSSVFANVSHEFDFGAVSLKPYAGLAYVSHATDSFSETGGPAALNSAADVIDATFASLGTGVEQQFVVGQDMLLTASGSVGWRHAFADTPISVHRFGTGPSFNITGQPVASDVLTLGAGLALDVGGGTSIDLTYGGQIGSGTQTHGLQGTWAKQF